VDIEEKRLKLAKAYGVNLTFNSEKQNVVDEVAKVTSGRGSDFAFEVVGITPTVQMAISTLRKGEALVLVGNLSDMVEFPLQNVVTREISVYGTCASCGEYSQCLDMIAGGEINVNLLISEVAPLEGGGVWFKKLYDKEPGLMKVILVPEIRISMESNKRDSHEIGKILTKEN